MKIQKSLKALTLILIASGITATSFAAPTTDTSPVVTCSYYSQEASTTTPNPNPNLRITAQMTANECMSHTGNIPATTSSTGSQIDVMCSYDPYQGRVVLPNTESKVGGPTITTTPPKLTLKVELMTELNCAQKHGTMPAALWEINVPAAPITPTARITPVTPAAPVALTPVCIWKDSRHYLYVSMGMNQDACSAKNGTIRLFSKEEFTKARQEATKLNINMKKTIELNQQKQTAINKLKPVQILTPQKQTSSAITGPTGNWCSWITADGCYHLDNATDQKTCNDIQGKWAENPSAADLQTAHQQLQTHNQSLSKCVTTPATAKSIAAPGAVTPARETAAAPAPVTTKSDCDNAYTSCMSKPGHTGCQKAHSLCLSTATTPAAVPAAAPAPAPVAATPTGQSSCDDVYNTCMSKPGHTGCQKARTNCLDVGTTNKR